MRSRSLLKLLLLALVDPTSGLLITAVCNKGIRRGNIRPAAIFTRPKNETVWQKPSETATNRPVVLKVTVTPLLSYVTSYFLVTSNVYVTF
jgi:hypothetical protein